LQAAVPLNVYITKSVRAGEDRIAAAGLGRGSLMGLARAGFIGLVDVQPVQCFTTIGRQRFLFRLAVVERQFAFSFEPVKVDITKCFLTKID